MPNKTCGALQRARHAPLVFKALLDSMRVQLSSDEHDKKYIYPGAWMMLEKNSIAIRITIESLVPQFHHRRILTGLPGATVAIDVVPSLQQIREAVDVPDAVIVLDAVLTPLVTSTTIRKSSSFVYLFVSVKQSTRQGVDASKRIAPRGAESRWNRRRGAGGEGGGGRG